MQTPSAKNIILIVAAAAIIGAAFIVSRYENGAYASVKKTPQDIMQLPVITATATSSATAVNYSGDWEKTLSTAVTGAWNSSSTSVTGSDASMSPTEAFSHDFFSRYAQAQSAGEDVTDPNVQQAIVKQVLADGTVMPDARVYTSSDIKIKTDNSSSSLQQYGYAIAAIFINDQNSGNNPSLETDIVQNAMNANDPSMLKQLDPFIASYQKIVNDLVATPVPSSMASMHIALINAMSEFLFADQSFEKIYTDALTGLTGVTAYKNGMQDFPQALLNIKKYFVTKDITFNPSTPASIFNVQK